MPIFRGHCRNLPRVIGLNAADCHERVGTAGYRIRYDVFEFANLVAAAGKSGVAIFALRVQLDFATEVFRQADEFSMGVGPKVSG